MVHKLKDLNKEKIVIKRNEQRHIPVNQEIKEAINQERIDGETQAETINRVLKTKSQMSDLLITMVESMEESPTKISAILGIIPTHLINLFEAIRNEKRQTIKDK